MKIIETGVLSDSSLYIHNPSSQAQDMFFYPTCTGHYYCDSNYIVSRNKFDSFLIMLIKNGKGSVTVDNKTTAFYSEQAVLVDCYKPHTYRAESDAEILWLHFDGSSSRNYYEAITENIGNVISLKDTYSFENNLKKIYTIFKDNKKISEALISKYITYLLTELLVLSNKDLNTYGQSEVIDETISYINENINQALSLNELSSRASLSVYYFTRVFKKETGYTPHEYIILTRINAAKFYLKSSPTFPVKEICYSCGFTSESNFCTTFKKLVGMTPSDYRNHFIN